MLVRRSIVHRILLKVGPLYRLLARVKIEPRENIVYLPTGLSPEHEYSRRGIEHITMHTRTGTINVHEYGGRSPIVFSVSTLAIRDIVSKVEQFPLDILGESNPIILSIEKSVSIQVEAVFVRNAGTYRINVSQSVPALIDQKIIPLQFPGVDRSREFVLNAWAVSTSGTSLPERFIQVPSAISEEIL